MKFNKLYKINENTPGFWRHYIFINNTSMIVLDRNFLRYEYRDDVDINIIEEEELEEVDVSKKNKVSKRSIIKGIIQSIEGITK